MAIHEVRHPQGDFSWSYTTLLFGCVIKQLEPNSPWHQTSFTSTVHAFVPHQKWILCTVLAARCYGIRHVTQACTQWYVPISAMYTATESYCNTIVITQCFWHRIVLLINWMIICVSRGIWTRPIVLVLYFSAIRTEGSPSSLVCSLTWTLYCCVQHLSVS